MIDYKKISKAVGTLNKTLETGILYTALMIPGAFMVYGAERATINEEPQASSLSELVTTEASLVIDNIVNEKGIVLSRYLSGKELNLRNDTLPNYFFPFLEFAGILGMAAITARKIYSARLDSIADEDFAKLKGDLERVAKENFAKRRRVT